MSKFAIQIIEKDTGEVVQFAPGREVEADLVDALLRQVEERPVGFFRTKARVKQAVEEAIEVVFFDLKRRVPRPRI